MKTTFRTTFDELEMENVNYLLNKRNLSKPQELLRLLVAETSHNERKFETQHGSKKSAVKRTNARERRKQLLELSDEDLTAKLMPLFDRDLRKTSEDTFEIFTEPNSKGRTVRTILQLPSGGTDMRKGPLAIQLSIWEKDKSLETIYDDD